MIYPPHSEDRCRHLYLISSSCGWIKIGASADPAKRMHDLSAACPPSVTLDLRRVMEFRGDREGVVHAALNEFRAHGEWFSAEALARIDAAGGFDQFVESLDSLPSRGIVIRPRGPDGRTKSGARWSAHRARNRVATRAAR